MPEDSKKNQHKTKHDAKEQRKPRSRHQAAAEKKVEKKVEETKVPAKPVYEDPGPEFYKNLKRETDEILKITEEANLKYKKKEIQSNWTKYEMPIESYEEIEEHENMGADYEKLIQAPLSIGGHFQFKHEKSWDISTAPSLYDKYFDIDMDNLAMSLLTIPFYERNSIDKSNFSPTDILSMENRSIKYKQKYYNDKSYTTAELEAHDKILNTLKDSLSKTVEIEDAKECVEKRTVSESKDITLKESDDVSNTEILSPIISNDKNVEETNLVIKTEPNKPIDCEIIEKSNTKEDVESSETNLDVKSDLEIDDIDDIILGNVEKIDYKPVLENKEVNIDSAVKIVPKAAENPEKARNPVVESPEDLEKWLDDFLDG